MAQVTRGVRAIFSNPQAYEAFQRAVGSYRVRRALVDDYVRAEPGLRVLEVGCGPRGLLEYLPQVSYTGTDLSAAYIESARRRHGARGRFVVGDVAGLDPAALGRFDVVIAKSLLHHIEDDEALHLFASAAAVLDAGGRLVTVDPAYTADMSRVARYVVGRDRGQNIRTPEAYRNLAASSFENVRVTVRHGLLRLPYTHAFMSCSRPLAPTGPASHTADTSV